MVCQTVHRAFVSTLYCEYEPNLPRVILHANDNVNINTTVMTWTHKTHRLIS